MGMKTAPLTAALLLSLLQAEAAPAPIELERRTLAFEPSRDDLNVGVAICVILAPEDDWTVKTPDEKPASHSNRDGWNTLELKETGRNRFLFPRTRIVPKGDESGPVCLNLKIWFKELPNEDDSPFYLNTPDRYALVSFCTEDTSRTLPRHSQNRVQTLDLFNERLSRPIALNMKNNRVPWRPNIYAAPDGTVCFHSFLIVRRDGDRSFHRKQIHRVRANGALETIPNPDLRRLPPWSARLGNLAAAPFETIATVGYREPIAPLENGQLCAQVLRRGGKRGALLYELRRIGPSGGSQTLAGSSIGFRNGKGSDAQFSSITAITPDRKGGVYVADGNPDHGSRIRHVAKDGTVTTVAGGSNFGFLDGPAEKALFHFPSALAVNEDGEIFAADPVNSGIRKIDATGTVTTAFGPDGMIQPSGVAIDGEGRLIALDGAQEMTRVRRLKADGGWETLAEIR